MSTELLEQKLAEMTAKYDAKLTEITAEKSAIGKLKSETDAKLEKAQADAIEMKQRLDAFETEMNRPGQAGGDDAAEVEARKEFNKFMRKDGNGNIEIRAMNEGSDPDGGYLVMPTISNQLITRVFESSPMRQLATVETVSGDSLDVLIDDQAAGAEWVGETQEPSETGTPQIGFKNIPVHKLSAKPHATQDFLDDSNMNIEQWLENKVADEFARKEATGYISGSGVKQPRGILTYDNYGSPGVYKRNAIEQILSGSSGAFTADGFIEQQNSLKEPYQDNAHWLIKRASFGQVRKLKTSDGQFLLGLGVDLTGKQQMTILGKPVMFADDMPAVAANALSVAYGDFRKGYTVVDRRGISILRDPYTNKPYVIFYTTKRVGGDVTKTEAIKLQKLAA